MKPSDCASSRDPVTLTTRILPEAGSKNSAKSLSSAGRSSATEAVPSAFSLDPEGKFLFAAGTASGRLASYRIDGDNGALIPLAVADVGPRPAAIAVVRLGN